MFTKTAHNRIMRLTMPRRIAKASKFMGDRKKLAKAVRARKGGKGESSGE